jgi:MoaA/NifB/PqqE/SkfB family radical SAM enzyme
VDGYTPEMNDAIRGKGVFKRAMEGVRKLVAVGFLPIITVVQTWEEYETDQILQNFTETLKSYGYSRPRIKIIPSLKIGREALRTAGYENSEYVSEEMLEGYDVSQLICSNSRMVTDRGVYVCPILIEEDDARMGKSLKDSAGSYHLKHQACFTCYLFGAICSNFTSVSRDA